MEWVVSSDENCKKLHFLPLRDREVDQNAIISGLKSKKRSDLNEMLFFTSLCTH